MSVRIRSLHIYPVKSCAGIDLSESPIDQAGLAFDRRWMVVSGGQFLTQRQLPAMALVQTALDDTHLHLSAPGMADLAVALDGAALHGEPQVVTVWRDTMPARRDSAQAAAWFSQFLRRPCEFLRIDVAGAQRSASAEWVGGWLQRHPEEAAGYAQRNLFGFADGFPLLIANQSSLDALNGKLAAQGKAAVPMDRFRPNIVVEGELEAYEEDHVASMSVGAVRMALVKPCTRCSIPDVDQATGVQHDEPGLTLAATHRLDLGVVFGQNAIVAAPAGSVLRIGDAVDVEFEF
ncbi:MULTISPECIES: MOSC domain-containing protein [unclassified Achromobacter]|uniref:MOSC domain-containing protein n=1 Tax=unclassified Achromobacter TaxID=2626865 RepID=UPI000B519B20|nr:MULTISPECIES: MOSC N-terminal beta barrel domain-containing protein [unclassified Achromobacter]OWT77278.1 MOSC domain-containing protein [Achromobacter sp. HZ28]OWT78159.1 MOSC domain-containing protein [Achromobacter sp. HZ34]